MSSGGAGTSDESTSGALPSGGSPGRGLIRISLVLAVLALVVRAGGFVREIVFSAFFGATGPTDAFYLAHSFLILAPMLLTSAVPQVFVARFNDGGSTGAGLRLFGGALLCFGVAFSALAGVIWWGADPFVRLLAPTYPPEVQAIAASCTRILAPGLPLLGISGVLMALARARGHFVLAQTAPLFLNLGGIVGLVLLHEQMGVRSAALGMVLGIGVMTLLMTSYPAVTRTMPRFGDRALQQGAAVLGAAALLVAMNHGGGLVMVFVDRLFAARLPEGHFSCMGYALRLIAVPHMLVFSSLLVVLLTAISKSAAGEDRAETSRLLNRGVRLTLLALVPILIALGVVAEPLTRLTYGRGAFGEEAVQLTALLLVCYLPTLLVEAIRNTLVTAFFGMGRLRTPVVLGVLRVAGVLVIFPFVWKPFGAVGLVLALGAVDVLLLPWILSRVKRELGFELRGLAVFLGRLAVVSAAGAAAAAGSMVGLSGALPAGPAGYAATVAVSLTAAGLAVVVASRPVGLTEVGQLLDLARARLRRA